MARLKQEVKRININGNHDAFLLILDGKEEGTISRHCRNCLWQVWHGIGKDSAMIGETDTKQEAVNMLVEECCRIYSGDSMN